MINSLEVDSIILEFGSKRVLQDVYIKNETGKISGILGRNGSGKTCLMNIIYGELVTNEKSVRLNGEVIFTGFRKPRQFQVFASIQLYSQKPENCQNFQGF